MNTRIRRKFKKTQRNQIFQNELVNLIQTLEIKEEFMKERLG